MADPDVRESVDALLQEKPEFEDSLRTLLAVDDRADSWTFDDVALDSGRFGELVSRGIVSRTDAGTYRLADSSAIRAGLDGGVRTEAGGGPISADGVLGSVTDRTGIDGSSVLTRVLRVTDVDRRSVVGVVSAMALLVLLRIVNYPAVFRGDYVVLPANDPYHYRYWVERLLAESTNPGDVGVVTALPPRVSMGEPLTYVLGWWLSALLGGSLEVAGLVVAWLPVLCSILVGAMVYAIGTSITGDRRIGIAAVAMFALLPAHAVYSGVGFFDHHPFDYVWLALTALCLVRLAVDLEGRLARGSGGDDPREGSTAIETHLRSPMTWGVAAALGIALTMQVFHWNGSPLLLWALALYVGTRALSDIRADHPSLVVNLPILVALGIAAVAAHLVHVRWGWQEPTVVYTPLLVLLGSIGVLVVAEVGRRLGSPIWLQLAGESVAAVGVVAGMWRFRPAYFDRLRVRSDALFGREGIAETRPLFTADLGFVLGPLDHFGFIFYLAVPILGLAVWLAVREHRPSWLVLATYGWYLTALTGIQLRFAGELSAFVAVAAGVGFVHLLSTVDIARRPGYGTADRFSTGEVGRRRRTDGPVIGIPSTTGIVYAALIFLVVSSMSLLMIWSLTGFIAIDDGQYETAMWIAADVDDDRPDYVLSEWGWNRMYNYFANGDADGYGYAANNYEPFIATDDPDAAYADRFADRVGYIVIADHDISAPDESAYTRLHEHLGSASDTVDGVGHYRAVHVTDDGDHVTFEVVPGAELTGSGSPDGSTSASTPVRIPGATFTYTRHITTDSDGTYSVTVAHPGEYEIGDEGTTVTVTEEDVRNGATIEVA